MNIHLENVNLNSNTGPNSFAKKLTKYASKAGCSFDLKQMPNAHLCFIESSRQSFDCPMFQRLDGIYFNTKFDYNLQNRNIKRTYEISNGVIFQSEFNKKLTTKYFGSHPNSIVIHNGADLEKINSTKVLNNSVLDGYESVWSCASNWRPHKRLKDNIRYFLEHSSNRECLVVAGKTDYPKAHDRIFFVGDLPHEALIALYKRSKYFLHLAWLDHCPNVVVDARASGCKIVCSTAGGTREIAGTNALIIEEDNWDMSPVDLYNPPQINFDKVVDNNINTDYNMNQATNKYIDFMRQSNEN